MNDIVRVCGFEISTGGLERQLERIFEQAESKTATWIVTLNTQMLSLASSDPEYERLLRTADVFVADGMPVVWAAKRMNPNIENFDRITGVDLVESLLKNPDSPLFAIIGGKDPSAAVRRYSGAVEKCRYVFSGVVLESDNQIEEFVKNILVNKVKLLFLALGVPKQDRLAVLLKPKLPGVTIIGVGGTFEILAPDGARAPIWMQNTGLEWLYRLIKEPRRLWRRYLLDYPSGVLFLIKDYKSTKKRS